MSAVYWVRILAGVGNKDLALVVVGKKKNWMMWLSLVSINLIYACTYICMKKASGYEFLSSGYVLWIVGAVVIIGVYALLWQQVIARMPLSTAYMFKGTSLIFVLLFSALLFGEGITWTNVLGSVIIIAGIVLFSKA